MSRSGTASPQLRRPQTTMASSASQSPPPTPPTPQVAPPIAFDIANSTKTFKGKLPIIVRPSSVTAAYASLRAAHIIPSQSSLVLAHSSSSSSSSYRGDKRMTADIAAAQKALAQSGQASLSLSAADRRAAIKKRAMQQQQERIKEKLWDKASLAGKKTLIGEEAAEVEALVKRVESDRIVRRKQWIGEEAARREDEDDEITYARARLSRYEERYVDEVARAERIKDRANRNKRSSADGKRIGRDIEESDEETSEDSGNDEDFEDTETMTEGKVNGDKLSSALPLSKVSSAASTSSKSDMRSASAELTAVREQIRLAEEERRRLEAVRDAERRKLEEDRLTESARRESERDTEAKRAAALLAAQQAEMQRMIEQLRQQVEAQTHTVTPITVLQPTATSAASPQPDTNHSSTAHSSLPSSPSSSTSSSLLPPHNPTIDKKQQSPLPVTPPVTGPPLPPRPYPPPRLSESSSASNAAITTLAVSSQPQTDITQSREKSASATTKPPPTERAVELIPSAASPKQVNAEFVYTDVDDDEGTRRELSRNSLNSSMTPAAAMMTPVVVAPYGQSVTSHSRENSVTSTTSDPSRPPSSMAAPTVAPPAQANNNPPRRSRDVDRDEDTDFFSGMMKDLAEFEHNDEERCRNGIEVTKIPRIGRPKSVHIFLQQIDGEYVVRWESKKKNADAAIIHVNQCRVVAGCREGAFKRSDMQKIYAKQSKSCFSLVTPQRSLDCVCVTPYYADLWTRTISRLAPQPKPIRGPISRTQSLFVNNSQSQSVNGAPSQQQQQGRLSSGGTANESSKQIESYLSKHLKGF